VTTVVQDAAVVRGRIGSQLFAAAWLAVALGIALELITALGVFALQGAGGAQGVLATVMQKITWSTLVCVGLAFAKVLVPRNQGAAAWAGILAAPIAFTIARSVHKGVAEALGLAFASAAPALLVLLATLKSLEYGVLGALIARLDSRPASTLGSYAGTGLLVGLVFGVVTLTVTGLLAPKPLPDAEWFARGVNEILFPVGCALVLFASAFAGRTLSSVSQPDA
jgi:hypothetical protein